MRQLIRKVAMFGVLAATGLALANCQRDENRGTTTTTTTTTTGTGAELRAAEPMDAGATMAGSSDLHAGHDLDGGMMGGQLDAGMMGGDTGMMRGADAGTRGTAR